MKDVFYPALCALKTELETPDQTFILVPHGLAYQATIIRHSKGAFNARLYDLALGIKCSFWPSCAKEWLTHPQLWQSQEEVKSIAEDVINLMIKSPTGNTSDLLWHVSFARAEYPISCLPLVYWYCSPWNLMKCFIQGFNHHIKPKVLNSYFIKTVFLYALERLLKNY